MESTKPVIPREMLSTGDLIFVQKTSCFMLFERFNAVKDTYTLNKSVVSFFMHVSLLISTEFELSFFFPPPLSSEHEMYLVIKHLAVYFSPDFVCMVQKFYQRSLPNKTFLLVSFLFCFVFLVKRLSIKYIGCLDNRPF